ncbi:MAG: PhoH family protein [Candidatus Paceibacterota bacterium]
MKKSPESETKAKKLFVLDTNVLLHDPGSLFHFGDNDVLIPMTVLEEMDGKKGGLSDVSYNARQVGRLLDEILIGATPRDISGGIPLKNGGRIFLQTSFTRPKNLPRGMDVKKADNAILGAVLSLQKKYPNRPVILVSQDINMRLKARALGVEVQDYRSTDTVVENADQLYSGAVQLPNDFWKSVNVINSSKEGPTTTYRLSGPICSSFSVNMLISLGGTKPFNAMVIACDKQAATATIVTTKDYMRCQVKGITARNIGQSQALSLLMNPEIDLVTILGQAGTGKTLLALAAALEQENLYSEIIFTRATVPADGTEEIGFLPGNEKEKLDPWMGALFDNLEVLQEKSIGFICKKIDKKDRRSSERDIGGGTQEKDDMRKRVKVKSLNLMRGRTFLKKFVVIDEAQNLTPKIVKTLITRAGPGTKVVCMGNLAQIDTPYVSECSSGLTYLVDRFRGWKHFGTITLEGVERSRLAAHAVEVL